MIFAKRPTKETYKRDLQKTQYRQSTSKETKHVLNYMHQTRLYIYIKRDLQKRPTKETYKRDLQKRPYRQSTSKETKHVLYAKRPGK